MRSKMETASDAMKERASAPGACWKLRSIRLVGMDLHRRRSVLVRMTEDGLQAGDRLDRQLPGCAVADLDLGLVADLLTDARPGRAKAKIYASDVALSGCAPVDQVLAVTCSSRAS
jgi:hypothetical protein